MAKATHMPRTAAPTKRGTAKSRATATNGARSRQRPRKKVSDMTADELGLLAWKKTYTNRDKRLDK